MTAPTPPTSPTPPAAPAASPATRPPRRPPRRGLAGYWPALAVLAVLAAFVLLLPSTAPTPEATAAAPLTQGTVGQIASGDPTKCPDRTDQIPGDPYSPPCVPWSNGTNNGGATAKGITADTIRVAYRITPDTDYASVIQQMAAPDIKPDTPESVQRTLRALTDYINAHFQFYGRKIELVPYEGKGTVVGEIFGGGQDTATADAVKVDTELNVFADLSAITEPYANALTRRKVIALSPPYVSDEWFNERRPYGWSLAPSCSLVSHASTEYANKRLFNRKAKWAGDELKDQIRKVALISPDNPEYQRCADDGQKEIEAAGNHFLRITYTLDLSTLPNQAASLISKLKAEGITSVGCACDPLLPIFLTGKAQEQGYEPEWLVMGTALTDTDFAGQLYEPHQWKRAFGASALGEQLPITANAAAKAYATVRDDTPAISAELLYYQLYMLAIGIQMAGPNITPFTFETGMQAYPERTGEAGTWKFLPGKYTPQIDAREIYWDPEKLSSFDFRKGAYVAVGDRMRLGEVTEEDPQVFTDAPPTTTTTAPGGTP